LATDYDELTIEYEEEGVLVVEELDKVVLQKGVWASVLFKYRQLDRKTGEMGPAKAALRRYQKSGGYYRKRDAINLNDKSAKLLVDTLKEWFEI
jgi:hypothetical protein